MIPNPIELRQSGVRSDLFVGRKQLIKDISAEQPTGTVHIVTGIRGQGKTSLMGRLRESISAYTALVLPIAIPENGSQIKSERSRVVEQLWKSAITPKDVRVRDWVAYRIRPHSTALAALLAVLGALAALFAALTTTLPSMIFVIIAAALAACTCAVGAAIAITMVVESDPTDASELFKRLAHSLKPHIRRVVILIDEADLELEQTRSIAKAVSLLVPNEYRQSYQVVLFCKPPAMAELSNAFFGPRVPEDLALHDFDEVDVEALMSIVTGKTRQSGDSDRALAEAVWCETGGIPNLTMTFLYDLWETWTRRSDQERGILVSDVRETARSREGKHISCLKSIIKNLCVPDSALQVHTRRILERIASEELLLNSPMGLDAMKTVLLPMTSNDASRAIAVDTLLKELIHANIITKRHDHLLVFRGRLVREGLRDFATSLHAATV